MFEFYKKNVSIRPLVFKLYFQLEWIIRKHNFITFLEIFYISLIKHFFVSFSCCIRSISSSIPINWKEIYSTKKI